MSDLRKKVVDASMDEVVSEAPKASLSVEDFVTRISHKFYLNQLKMFPQYCEETRILQAMHNKELEQVGIKGKYTESYGWSKSGELLMKGQVHENLRLFMMNMVYKEFWEDTNAKRRDKFMIRVYSGQSNYEYAQMLATEMKYYGANYQNLGQGIITGPASF